LTSFTGSLTKMALEGMMDASEDVENSPAMKQAEKSILDVQNVLSILLELVNQITLTLSTIAAGGEGGVLGKTRKSKNERCEHSVMEELSKLCVTVIDCNYRCSNFY